MSYFLFGTFSAMYKKEILRQIKAYGKDKNIYIWFNEEIVFYEEIQRMLMEQKSEGDFRFAITSKYQPHNSSDVLFPFDKFSSDILFSDKSRSFYKKCCKDNLDILFDCIRILINSLHIKQIDFFVVEGYDDNFQKKYVI